MDPEAGAVDVLADVGDEGQQQQADAEEGEGVAVALEVAGPADEQQGGDEGGDRRGGPDRLQPGLGGRKAGDEHVADAVEQAGRRQQDGVGVGGQPAHGQMGDEQQGEDDAEEGSDVGGQVAGLAEAGQGVEAAGEQDGQHDQPELGPAASRGAGRRAGRPGAEERPHFFVVVVVDRLAFGMVVVVVVVVVAAWAAAWAWASWATMLLTY